MFDINTENLAGLFLLYVSKNLLSSIKRSMLPMKQSKPKRIIATLCRPGEGEDLVHDFLYKQKGDLMCEKPDCLARRIPGI